MSEYMTFFIKFGKQYVPVGEYSRSSAIYQNIKGIVPYGKIDCLSESKIMDVIRSLDSQVSQLKTYIVNLRAEIERIPSYNNTIDEKVDRINGLKDSIEDADCEIGELDYACGFYHTLLNAIDAVKYDDDFKDIDTDRYIYAGIEVGASVGEGDVYKRDEQG